MFYNTVNSNEIKGKVSSLTKSTEIRAKFGVKISCFILNENNYNE